MNAVAIDNSFEGEGLVRVGLYAYFNLSQEIYDSNLRSELG